MLYSGSDVIRDLEWVIFDEVHYINDAEVRRVELAFLGPDLWSFSPSLSEGCFYHPFTSTPNFIPRKASMT